MHSNLAIFYHVWAPPQTGAAGDSGMWRLLIDEQIKRIQRSGLMNHADVFCCVSGKNHKLVADFIRLTPWVNIIEETADESQFEGVTLKHLLWFAQTKAQYRALGYFHTKGVSVTADQDPRRFRAINSWRHLMETAVIDRWRDAYLRLENYDAVGAIFVEEPWPHYRGNFWWATPKYLRNLIHPVTGEYPDNFYFDGQPQFKLRTNAERWIGLNKPKPFSFFTYPFKVAGKTVSNDKNFDFYTHDVGDYYLNNLI